MCTENCRQLKKIESIIDTLRKQIKWNHKKCSVKTSKRIKGGGREQKTIMMNRKQLQKGRINPNTSGITLNVNGSHMLIKEIEECLSELSSHKWYVWTLNAYS